MSLSEYSSSDGSMLAGKLPNVKLMLIVIKSTRSIEEASFRLLVGTSTH